MRKLLQALSPADELVIVVAGAFGPSMARSIYAAVYATGQARLISQSSLTLLLVQEIATLLVLGGFLLIRGWTFAHIGLRPSLRETLFGIALVAIVEFIDTVVWIFAALASRQLLEAGNAFSPVDGTLSLATIVVVSAVNPIFEETFLCGYLISALKKQTSASTAINVSVAIRLLCHLYQGVVGVISIVPIGLIFAYIYVRWGRLWPLIVAHAVLDLIGLLAYS